MSDRKYRQAGYQDSGAPDRPASSAVTERAEGPRGRGLGAPTATLFRCARCGAEASPAELGPATVCRGCSADLHTCTNCGSFDPSARFECRQPIVVAVRSKAKANECPAFGPKLLAEQAREAAPRDARSAFDALFKF